MLEQPILLVHGWTRGDGPTSDWTRRITDAGGRSLGCVRLAGDPHGSWLSWFRKQRLDVFETDDASHLMTVTRSWGMLRIWDVEDAEERPVGTIYARTIVTSEGEMLAAIDIESPERIRLVDGAGQLVARIIRKEAVAAVEFGVPINPFVRMLVLGCALALEPPNV